MKSRPPTDTAAAATSKPTTTTTATTTNKKSAKKSKPPPLPATVHARGYEIAIPSVKICWRVHILHSCGRHPVLDQDAQSPSSEPAQPLVIDFSRHPMRACTQRCKNGDMEHVSTDSEEKNGPCAVCARERKEADLQHLLEEHSAAWEHLLGKADGVWDGKDPGMVFDGMPR